MKLKRLADVLQVSAYLLILVLMALTIFLWLPTTNTITTAHKAWIYVGSIYFVSSIHVLHWFMIIVQQSKTFLMILLIVCGLSALTQLTHTHQTFGLMIVALAAMMCGHACITSIVEHLCTRATGKPASERHTILCDDSWNPIA